MELRTDMVICLDSVPYPNVTKSNQRVSWLFDMPMFYDARESDPYVNLAPS